LRVGSDRKGEQRGDEQEEKDGQHRAPCAPSSRDIAADQVKHL
jgi:hypothetical protein